DPKIPRSSLAFIGMQNILVCSTSTDMQLLNIAPGTGYIIQFAEPLNSTDIFISSEPFEIKPPDSAYPTTTPGIISSASPSPIPRTGFWTAPLPAIYSTEFSTVPLPAIHSTEFRTASPPILSAEFSTVSPSPTSSGTNTAPGPSVPSDNSESKPNGAVGVGMGVKAASVVGTAVMGVLGLVM
ncbi:hypothetical protein C0995_006327, partial [Termitomyces sp. Mi166